MLYHTTLEQFHELCRKSDQVVVLKEIYGDLLTPTRVFQALAKSEKNAVLLDSSDHPSSEAACIYIGLKPVAEYYATGSDITIVAEGQTQSLQGDAFEELRHFYHRYQYTSPHTLSKFSGGMIGFISYDAIRLFEDIPDRHRNVEQIPDLCFKVYGTNIVFDKRSGKVIISRTVKTEDDIDACYAKIMQEINGIIKQMVESQATVSVVTEAQEPAPLPIHSDIDDKTYQRLVKRAQQYIQQGDAFQIVLSRSFYTDYTGDAFNVYRALRVKNPSPYQFYIRGEHYTLVGSSPERLVSLQQGIVETMPIAGTRPRGDTLTEDQALEESLLKDEKELAEHTMLVDLGRNDVGAISEPGSVKVAEYQKVNKFSRVMHIVSRVQGTLRAQYDAFDVLKAVFPAGTLSGAPKIRAMEIIDELEVTRRGVYGGAVCTIDNEGQLDSCITIRTALLKDGKACVRAGAGIVLDSDPKAEADETRYKAQAVFDAIASAQRGFL